MKDLLALVEPMVPTLRRYARALMHDPHLADDLVQDCLERVVKRWEQRRHQDDTRQWVFSIAHNLAMDWLRQQRRRGLHLAIEDVEEKEMVTPAAQEAHIRHHELLGFLDRLPHEQRSVILLVSVEDFSYAEAAKALDIPIGTVMSRLARGRERLLRAMEGEPRQQKPERGSQPALRRLK
ncbi:RNA polymerase sigma factor [Ideonella azotifigens]|uniref:Sigma-70 family RNA polymerase sigma factor n=2 Tax=Ideonella azotifigens TaxID=513160 RepID=A0ABN1JU37_9BURK|nr:RNA polymerase sigma factor [Ideonella azotifigens]MCD2341104.1 RNA polymerase sigma factor [Ideonella azotifigens]